MEHEHACKTHWKFQKLRYDTGVIVKEGVTEQNLMGIELNTIILVHTTHVFTLALIAQF